MMKIMHMEPLPHYNKITARQPTHKLVLIHNTIMSKNSSCISLNKQMIMKESNHTSSTRFITCKITSEKTKKGLISTRQKAYPASARLLGLIGPFIDCATFQGLNFSGFVVVTAVVVAVYLLLRLLENIKLWRWLVHRYNEAKRRVKSKARDETRIVAVGGRRWTWIEDLVAGLDVSGGGDLFISTCILMGLGLLWGVLVLVRRFSYKNVEEWKQFNEGWKGLKLQSNMDLDKDR